MARAAASTDVFTAVAEPRRRALLDCLVPGERDVTGLVERLGWPQAQVSKHLAVLRQADLVRVRLSGRRRFYRLNGERLKPLFDWSASFETFWTDHLGRIKARAEGLDPRKDLPS